MEVLRDHVLEPKSRAGVIGAIFNFCSSAATFYTTYSMQVRGGDKWLGYGVGCAHAGIGVGNIVSACEAYEQIKTVNGRLKRLTQFRDMLNLMLERVTAQNDLVQVSTPC